MSTDKTAEGPSYNDALTKLDISNLTIDEIRGLENKVLRDTLNDIVKNDGAMMHVSHTDHSAFVKLV